MAIVPLPGGGGFYDDVTGQIVAYDPVASATFQTEPFTTSLPTALAPADPTPTPATAPTAGFDLQAAISSFNVDSILQALTSGSITYEMALDAIAQVNASVGAPDPFGSAVQLLSDVGLSPESGFLPTGATQTPDATGGGLTFQGVSPLLDPFQQEQLGGLEFGSQIDEMAGGVPTEGRRLAFQEELPSEAFIRFLAGRRPTGPEGQPQAFAPRVQQAAQGRGTALQTLGPLFGAGLPGGLPFFDFFQQQQGALPGLAQTRGFLGDLATAVGTPAEMLSPTQTGLLGAFETPETRRNVILTNLLARTNPALRGGLQECLQSYVQPATGPHA